ncbi:MAG TPA: 6-phosphogluconolactonase [Chitinophagaceae bacterium]
MEPYVANTVEELSRHAATWMSNYIQDVLQKQERFAIALSGGTTPKRIYELLATEEYSKNIDWSKVHFFWGDERFVPFTDERNNAAMAYKSLLDKVPVQRDHVHVMRTDLAPHESASAYEKLLHTYFDKQTHTFDLVLLGIGGDAHTLSLFPGLPVLHEKIKWVTSFFLKAQEMYRITLTAPVVNKAASILFLASGADKAVAVNSILYGNHDPELYPAQLIQPYNGNCHWFIDAAAAAEISDR